MPRNIYFSQGTANEINLYEDIVIEGLKIYGHDVLYIPRDIIKIDTILNEDVQSEFNDAYSIEMYINNTEGFEGEGSLLSKFGLEIRDSATFTVAKRSWEKFVGIQNNLVNSNRPREGDLIYLPLSKTLFEVKFVEHEKPFYQIQNLPTYELSVEIFEYSNEDFDTGVEEIDEIQRDNDFSQTFITGIEQQTNLMLPIGHEVYQWLDDAETIKVTGVIANYDYDDSINAGVITITDIESNSQDEKSVNLFTEGKDLFSDSYTGALFELTEERKLDDVNDNSDRNKDFEDFADNILDFTENNPFGEL